MLNVSKWLHTAKPLEAQRSQTALACTLFLKHLKQKNILGCTYPLKTCHEFKRWESVGLPMAFDPKASKWIITNSHIHSNMPAQGFFFFFFFSLILENRTFPDDNHEICGFVWVNSPSLPSLFFTSACSEINPCGYHPERASLSQESWKTYSYNSH